jgi:nucleoid-associated protein YgaU
VDGDTLASLAKRYLGDAARAGEIFEANRDVLPSPDTLPIGAILRIPPRCPSEADGPARKLGGTP